MKNLQNFLNIVYCKIIPLLAFFLLGNNLYSQTPSFHGAEGFGSATPGGRGGKVLIVTKLDDDLSEGTLRWAVNQQYPRIIVFALSGIIFLESPLEIGGERGHPPSGDNPYSLLTIAGQTAPGEGIILTNYPISLINDVHDIIIRNIRVRKTFVNQMLGSIGDGIEFGGCYNVVLDHCSFSWFADEGVSIESTNKRMNHDITIQNCLIAEGLLNGGHPAGPRSRAMIASDGTYNVSMHHNLMISCNRRNPNLGGNSDLGNSDFPLIDVRYNLVYNFGEKGIQFSRGAQVNIVGNILRYGPQTTADKPFEAVDKDSAGTKIYLEKNCTIKRIGNIDILNCPENQDELVFAEKGMFAEIINLPFDTPAITQIEKLETYLLENAGALPRDNADSLFIKDYKNYTGRLGADNKSQDEIVIVEPKRGTASLDADKDGMPDDWENANGLNPGIDDSSGDIDGDGYTNIEDYINSFFESNVTGIDIIDSKMPVEFILFQNYPNPFNPVTKIKFAIPFVGVQHAEPLQTRLEIFDILGRKIQTLLNGSLPPGTYEIDFKGGNLSSGIYFYKLQYGEFTAIKKSTLIK